MADKVDIAFGTGTIPFHTDPKLADWKVIQPTFEPALKDPHSAFRDAARNPIEGPVLRDVVRSGERVVIVTSDGTRPVPNRQLIPWILAEIPTPAESVTILLGNGTHRATTPQEIESMFGSDLSSRITILNHDGYDVARNEAVGRTETGTEVTLDKVYLEADRRIVLGFIEPHFFAGFSGGAKGVTPGVAGVETILNFHNAELIGHPQSTWGVLEGNPIQAEIQSAVSLCPPDFLVNVTLNSEKRITEFFLGDYIRAHASGCEKAREAAMVEVEEPFPLVLTSNSGYPLDQNLYQTVKGISAAARIVDEGGTIVVASECFDGIPDHGNFAEIMKTGSTPGDVLKLIRDLDAPILDQWQAQILSGILEKAKVEVYARMDPDEIESCKLTQTADLQGSVEARLRCLDAPSRAAVLPDGPLTIPYLKEI